MKKLALCVGINEYPNAPLYGCVNDANDWGDLLQSLDYNLYILLNGEATKSAILGALRNLISQARWGDRVVFTYSGHGSWVPDRNGDESDGRDEVLCAVDYENGGWILDDEIQQIIATKRRGVRVTIFSDSCHSGSVSRFTGSAKTHPKFVSPFSFLTNPVDLRRADRAQNVDPTTTPRTSKDSVLFSGCGDTEVSYDAWIDGRYNGAFTYYALAARQENDKHGVKNTYRNWHTEIRDWLPYVGRYNQSPQLYASLWQRRWLL